MGSLYRPKLKSGARGAPFLNIRFHHIRCYEDGTMADIQRRQAK
jgi:hypothetical protein